MASFLPAPPMGGLPPDGPPPPAPGTPSLANIPQGQTPPADAGGALPRLVYQIDQSIQTLARALPADQSQKLDAIRQQLREVVAGALSGGMGQAQQSGVLSPAAGPY